MKNFMKKLNKVMTLAAWLYLAYVSGCYINFCLMDGIVDVWENSVHLDKYGTVVIVIAGLVLIINYPVQAIKKLISDWWNKMKKDYEAKRKAKEERKSEVPIVTFE